MNCTIFLVYLFTRFPMLWWRRIGDAVHNYNMKVIIYSINFYYFFVMFRLNNSFQELTCNDSFPSYIAADLTFPTPPHNITHYRHRQAIYRYNYQPMVPTIPSHTAALQSAILPPNTHNLHHHHCCNNGLECEPLFTVYHDQNPIYQDFCSSVPPPLHHMHININ